MIVFPTAYGPGRPVRLSEDTRRFAYDSLHHRYGQDTLRTPHVCMDEVAGIGEMNRLELYDAAIRRIAEEAPVRICDGERISGAAPPLKSEVESVDSFTCIKDKRRPNTRI